ncbi:MAG: DUF4157 domain-containing protein [Scytolyngbya sp. HA4215-MV1]|jgi:outer membrane protein OmpA-like peptidoglycan-associated protein|nr:DUF4157 domain-containing protein [Scytolyngbya sp. HA4215-MV1]
MADSHSTATAEATKATSTAHPPVQDTMNVTAEKESDRASMMGDRMVRAIGGGSPEALPERFAGALGQMSGASQVGMMRRLQRSYGNSYVGRVIQAKLTVGQPGDVYEQEADQIADQVMRMPDQPSSNHELSFSSVHASTAQRKCTACEEEDKLQRKESGSMGGTPATVPPVVHEVLSSPGQPLGMTERAFMEPRFGQDFSDVRVHTDAKAAESAAAVQARAYTVGNNIVFGGKESPSDLPVLAHELTHVVQQSGASPMLQRLAYCADFLELTRRPGVKENQVRDSLAADAASFGTVEREFCIPAASFDPYRPGKQEIRWDKRTPDCLQGDGKADIALLNGSTLEIIEVKEATWDEDTGAPAAEEQLANYLSKAADRPDIVNELWRASGHTAGEITSVTAMPMTRLSLWPNPRAIGRELVSLRWCRDGIVVFKVEPYEKEEEEDKKPKDKKPKDKKPKDKKPSPSDTIPEQLLKLGEKLAEVLAAPRVLEASLALVQALGTFEFSELLLIGGLGVVAFHWRQILAAGRELAERIMSLAGKILGGVEEIAEDVLATAGKILAQAKEIVEDVMSLAGKILGLVEEIAERIISLGEEIAEDIISLGDKIASIAESVGRFLFGSNDTDWLSLYIKDLTPPVIDMPVTEDLTHCATVAHEDTFIKIDAELLFDTGNGDLKPEAIAHLEKIVPLLQKVVSLLQKDDSIRIEGYADNRGDDNLNNPLSEQRAEAVALWFVKHGVLPMSRIQKEGYGKTRAQYNDPEGRKKDRRVEIWVPKHGSVEKVCW